MFWDNNTQFLLEVDNERRLLSDHLRFARSFRGSQWLTAGRFIRYVLGLEQQLLQSACI